MNMVSKQISTLGVVLLSILSMQQAFAAGSSSGSGSLMTHGLTITNNSKSTVNIYYTYATSSTACVDGTKSSNSQCTVAKSVAPGNSITAISPSSPANGFIQQFPHYGQTSFQMCTGSDSTCSDPSKLICTGTLGQDLKTPESLLFTQLDASGQTLLPPPLYKNTYTPYQPFSDKYGDVLVMTPDLANDAYSMSVINAPDNVNVPKNSDGTDITMPITLSNGTSGNITLSYKVPPSGLACEFNIPTQRYDLEVVTPPSEKVSPSNYDYKNNPLAILNNFFIDNNINYDLMSSGNRQQYYIAINGKEVFPNNSSTLPLSVWTSTDTQSDAYSYGNLYGNLTAASYADCPGNACTLSICACDPGINASELLNGQGGICPTGGITACTPPSTPYTGVASNNWGNTGGSVVGTTYTFQLYNGVVAAYPSAIATTNGPITSTNNASSLTRLTVPIVYKTGEVSIPLDGYFSLPNNGGASDAVKSYSIVQDLDVVPDYPNGQTGSLTDGAGTHWGPIYLPIDGAPTAPPTSDTSPCTASSSAALCITDDKLTVNTDLLTNNTIVQLTIEATDTSGYNAYQTIYLNVSSQNTVDIAKYSPLKPGLGAWMYGANITPGLVTYDNNGNPSCNSSKSATPYSSCNANSWDYPNCQFLNAVNNTEQTVSIVTPDMGWVQFGTLYNYTRHWDDSVGPLNNNMYVDPTLSCLGQYYHNNAKSTKFLITYEFDGSLKGYLPSLSDNTISGSSTSSQQATLASNVVSPLINDVVTANATFPASSFDGLQFDVEPLPTDAKSTFFFKRVADLLARHGKINEIFAFADADSPGLIMAQGPLGIFLPSTYDVGQKIDNAYMSSYTYTAGNPAGTKFAPNMVGNPPAFPTPGTIPTPSTPNTLCTTYPEAYLYPWIDTSKSTCPLTLYDYACHYDPTATSTNNYLDIKSYCNIDINNTLANNSVRFGMVDNKNINTSGNQNPDFSIDQEVYGGHFQLAVPSEGSATAWTYEIVYTPRLANSSGGGCVAENQQTSPCTVPSVPSTYEPIYIHVPSSDVAETEKNLEDTVSQYSASTSPALQSGVTLPLPIHPAAGQYYVFYSGSTNTQAGVPPCSMSTADTGTNITMCDAIELSANANQENDPVANAAFTGSNSGDHRITSQYAYINALIGLAEPSSAASQRYNFRNGVALGTPADNANNLGLAFYALATESSYGCIPGGSHGGVPNCLESFPLSTAYLDPNDPDYNNYGGDIWALANSYIGGAVPPSSVTLQPAFSATTTNNGYLSQVITIKGQTTAPTTLFVEDQNNNVLSSNVQNSQNSPVTFDFPIPVGVTTLNYALYQGSLTTPAVGTPIATATLPMSQVVYMTAVPYLYGQSSFAVQFNQKLENIVLHGVAGVANGDYPFTNPNNGYASFPLNIPSYPAATLPSSGYIYVATQSGQPESPRLCLVSDVKTCTDQP